MIRRVIFIATPHDGSPVATTLIGKFATRVVRRPSDSAAGHRPDRPRQPRRLAAVPGSPGSQQHRRAGGRQSPAPRHATTSLQPRRDSPHHRRPRDSFPRSCPGRPGRAAVERHLDEAVSEHWVPAIHTNIYYQPQTIAEVQRILAEQAASKVIASSQDSFVDPN